MPNTIPDTWHFNGEWLGRFCLVTTEELDNPIPKPDKFLCPICEYPEAFRLSVLSHQYPYLYYCPECYSIWGWYVARCPECELGAMWNKNTPEGLVTCSLCGYQSDVGSVQEINDDPDFRQDFTDSS